MTIKQPVLILILLLLSVISIASGNNYRYSYIPKKVYATQIFPITLYSDKDLSHTTPIFTFTSNTTIQPINNKPLINTNNGTAFYTFYFKATNNNVATLKLTITNNHKTTIMQNINIPVEKLDSSKQKNFCGLIATAFKIVTSQVSEFDANNNLVFITIKASEANPEEIVVPGSLESGIEKIVRSGSDVTIEYYFVIPSSIKEITLSYYNTLQNRFIPKTISTDYQSSPVAAQESLNPKDSSFNKIKKYGIISLALIFFWMFWQKKEILFLTFCTLSVIVLLIMYSPRKSICIQEGAPLYILPTYISTIGGQIDSELVTTELSKKGVYHKIKYKNNIIGWIKDEDTCKD